MNELLELVNELIDNAELKQNNNYNEYVRISERANHKQDYYNMGYYNGLSIGKKVEQSDLKMIAEKINELMRI